MVEKNKFERCMYSLRGAYDEKIHEKLSAVDDALNKSDEELENALNAFIEICGSQFTFRGAVPHQEQGEEMELNRIEVRNSIKSRVEEVLNEWNK